MSIVFILVRTITYVTVFLGLVLIYIPSRLLSGSGVVRPASIESLQVAGIAFGFVGALIVLWSILTFIFIGRGTPAPFDPPRRLVVRGPYKFVRNPLYIGSLLITTGVALFYESLIIFGFTVLLFLFFHFFVVWYEEPVLKQNFGGDYDAYCRQVRRWRLLFSKKI